MVRVVVDSRVRVSLDGVPAEVAANLRARFEHENPAFGKKAGEPERYVTWTAEGGVLAVPRGGMARVREVLRGAGLAWSVSDERTWRHPEPGFPDHLRTERPYQTRMRLAVEQKQNCLLHGATGAGKTCVLYSLLARLKRRALVMVWTDALLKQWLDRAVEEFGMAASDVGVVQGTTERIEPLTLCMQQTIASRFKRGDTSLVDEFDIFLYDEVQRAPARTCFAAIDPFRSRYRVGVSADSTRRDELEFLTRDLFGDVAEEITEEETTRVGATVDVEVYVVPTAFRAPMHYVRNPRLYHKLLECMATDEERNALVLRIAGSVVEQGHQVLLFTHRVEHARTLDSRLVGMGIHSGVLLGGVENKVAFERSVEGFRSGAHRAGVGTYQAVGQGIDLPTVSRGICITPIWNNRQLFGQVRGRICRSAEGKEFGRMYCLVDPMYGRKPVRNFLEWAKTVKVLDGREWVDGAAWLRSSRAA